MIVETTSKNPYVTAWINGGWLGVPERLLKRFLGDEADEHVQLRTRRFYGFLEAKSTYDCLRREVAQLRRYALDEWTGDTRIKVDDSPIPEKVRLVIDRWEEADQYAEISITPSAARKLAVRLIEAAGRAE